MDSSMATLPGRTWVCGMLRACDCGAYRDWVGQGAPEVSWTKLAIGDLH